MIILNKTFILSFIHTTSLWLRWTPPLGVHYEEGITMKTLPKRANPELHCVPLLIHNQFRTLKGDLRKSQNKVNQATNIRSTETNTVCQSKYWLCWRVLIPSFAICYISRGLEVTVFSFRDKVNVSWFWSRCCWLLVRVRIQISTTRLTCKSWKSSRRTT